jgi:hypothetical protein
MCVTTDSEQYHVYDAVTVLYVAMYVAYRSQLYTLFDPYYYCKAAWDPIMR